MSLTAIMIGLAAAQAGTGVLGLIQNKKAREESRSLAEIQQGDEQNKFNQKIKNDERNLALNEEKLAFDKGQNTLTSKMQAEDMQRGQDKYARDAMNASTKKKTQSAIGDKNKQINRLGMLKSKSTMLGE